MDHRQANHSTVPLNVFRKISPNILTACTCWRVTPSTSAAICCALLMSPVKHKSEAMDSTKLAVDSVDMKRSDKTRALKQTKYSNQLFLREITPDRITIDITMHLVSCKHFSNIFQKFYSRYFRILGKSSDFRKRLYFLTLWMRTVYLLSTSNIFFSDASRCSEFFLYGIQYLE